MTSVSLECPGYTWLWPCFHFFLSGMMGVCDSLEGVVWRERNWPHVARTLFSNYLVTRTVQGIWLDLMDTTFKNAIMHWSIGFLRIHLALLYLGEERQKGGASWSGVWISVLARLCAQTVAVHNCSQQTSKRRGRSTPLNCVCHNMHYFFELGHEISSMRSVAIFTGNP